MCQMVDFELLGGSYVLKCALSIGKHYIYVDFKFTLVIRR